MISMEKIYGSSFVSVTEEERLNMLNSQLRYAAENSPFYRRHLASVGSCKSLSDLADLPTISANDIREQGRYMVCVGADEVKRIVSLQTTGTTGKPKRLYFSENDLRRTVDFFAEGMSWMCSAGDKVGIFMPCASPDGIGDLLSRGLEKLGAIPVKFGMIQRAFDVADAVKAADCRVFVGIPWQMRLLSLTCPELRPETVLLSADYMPESLKSFLSRQWGCCVLNHFGMTETGYGGAVENERHDGMYLRRDELIAEILDPESGAPLPYGEIGELTLTTLRREAMPLIRCRTGDYARMLDDGRIDRIFGRIGADETQYRLQEFLAPIDWLYDYSTEKSESCLQLCTELALNAPKDAQDVLLSIVSELTPVCDIIANRVSLSDARVMYSAKRMN